MPGKYYKEYSDQFKKSLKKYRKKRELILRLKSKIDEICENPSHYKHLRNILKKQQPIHIGSFVLTS